MTTIYLIRHAESEGNLFRTCQGHRDELLSQTGLQQCKVLHQRFKKTRVDAVYSSDLCRAAVTAQSVARAQSPAVPHYAAYDLREKALGKLEGESWGMVFRMYPSMRTGKVDGGLRDYGGENDDELKARAVACMETIVRRHPGQSVAVVSHGGCISSFLRAKFPEDARLSRVSGNTSVTTLTWEDGIWTLVENNDTSHLDKAGVPHASLFREGVTDLWYRPVDFVHDEDILRKLGTDAWRTVYGNTDRFNPEIFLENAEKMCRFEGCASFCMDEEKIAGLLLLDPMQDDERSVGHISLIYLEPEYRYRGIGCQLIGRASVVYRAMGMDTLRLHVARQNKTAIGFYKKHGFIQSGLPSFSGQLVMKKNIGIPKFEFAPW